jgi:hypothetical protein
MTVAGEPTTATFCHHRKYMSIKGMHHCVAISVIDIFLCMHKKHVLKSHLDIVREPGD